MTEERSFTRSAVNCLLCGKTGVNFSLSDGTVVHKACVIRLQTQEASAYEEIERVEAIRRRIEKQRAQIRVESDSLSGFFKSMFGGRDFKAELSAIDDPDRDKELSQLAKKSAADLRSVQMDLRCLYDQWPDYPPDWEERRKRLKLARNDECERCGLGPEGTLQAHHIKPYWKGGSNKQDNLELLCVRCHGNEHNQDFETHGYSDHQTKVSNKEETISAAIENGQDITFMYKEFGEKRGSRRTIEPWGFVDVESGRRSGFTRCIEGYCYLREDRRRFAAHRMYKVEVLP